MKEKIIFLVGPTASGKTDLAVKLAKINNAEIISCDSMQVYKGMKIISSQPGIGLQKAIPQHLISFISPEKEFNVSEFRKKALAKIKTIIKKGKIPLFVGGSGLYMSVLVDGIFEIKAENQALREKLYQEAQKFGSNYLHEKLNKVDAQAASKIHPHDTRRIVRALEVFATTGKRISELQKLRKGIIDQYDVRIFGLAVDRDILKKRIALRTAKMFKQGLIKEVKKLLKKKLSKTAGVAIGLREIKGYLEGKYDLAEAKRQMIQNTCLYAKRQMTWFNKDKRIQWIEPNKAINFIIEGIK